MAKNRSRTNPAPDSGPPPRSQERRGRVRRRRTSKPKDAAEAPEPVQPKPGRSGKRTARRPADPKARAKKIAALRDRIDSLQQQLAELTDEPAETQPAGARGNERTPAAPPADRPDQPPPSSDPRAEREELVWPGHAGDPARDLLTSDYFRRQWGRLGVRRRSTELDEFGLDAKAEGRLRPLLEFVARSYFRTDVAGMHQIPGTGRCLLVANHSGGPVPYDGLLLRTLIRKEHPNHRELRWLSEDLFYHLPFVGVFMSRLGGVRACQENAQRLLKQGQIVAVFPEGAKGAGKLYRNRYRLQRFGRGGYIRLCIRTHTPLVPCAIVGAEEANPMLYRFEYMTRFLGVPYVPVTPTFPLLGPLGLLPAPTKLTVRFGEPMYFDGYAPEAADDAVLVGRLSDRVRASIQRMLDDILEKRESVFFG